MTRRGRYVSGEEAGLRLPRPHEHAVGPGRAPGATTGALATLRRKIDAKGQNSNCQEIASTLWAPATLNELRPKLVARLCREVNATCQYFNCQVTAYTLRALATLMEQQLKLMERL